jgi:CheY-like chemotaxis protein
MEERERRSGKDRRLAVDRRKFDDPNHKGRERRSRRSRRSGVERRKAESILNRKSILAVDDEPDVLAILEEEIMAACPGCTFHKATTYEQANELIRAWTYELIILDIMGVRGFDLLELAVAYQRPVVMLTAHALNPEALKRSIEMGARAYLPKEKLGEIVPFLEDVLKYENLAAWGRLLTNLKGRFIFRWGENWKKVDEKFWKEFDKKIALIKK